MLRARSSHDARSGTPGCLLTTACLATRHGVCVRGGGGAGLGAVEDELSKILGASITVGESNSALVIGPRGCGKSLAVGRAIKHATTQLDAQQRGYYTVRLNGLLHRCGWRGATRLVQCHCLCGNRGNAASAGISACAPPQRRPSSQSWTRRNTCVLLPPASPHPFRPALWVWGLDFVVLSPLPTAPCCHCNCTCSDDNVALKEMARQIEVQSRAQADTDVGTKRRVSTAETVQTLLQGNAAAASTARLRFGQAARPADGNGRVAATAAWPGSRSRWCCLAGAKRPCST